MSYNKSNLKMSAKGNMYPMYPSRTYDNRRDLITPPTTNMNSAPLFYIGDRVNTLWSSTSPVSPLAIGIMRFGNNQYSLHDVFGNMKHVKGQLLPDKVPNLNLNVDYNGNYKLLDLAGNSHKIYSDSHGNYVKYNKSQFYL